MPGNSKLGSGLDAIFGSDINSLLDDIQNGNEPEGVTTSNISLPLADIKPNPYQPREIFDEEKLEELADSIKEHGMFTPVLVRRVSDGYELVAGERRSKAAEIAGLTEIPAIIVDFDDDQMMEISLLENIQRENLTSIEEAKAYKNLIDKRGYTQEELGKRVSKSREHVANTLRLLSLPDKVQKLVENGTLSASSALPPYNNAYHWHDRNYFDGGISDPIPHTLAFSEGCEKVVIILTLPKTHFRDTSKDAEAAEKMKKYPAMVPLMRHKSELYNRQLKEALELEEKGKVLIVAPDGYFKGGSLAKDRNQIMQIYEEGYVKARMISDFIYFSNPSGSLER